jgi:transporter family-2 protein
MKIGYHACITTKKDKLMESIFFILLIGLAGGIAVGLQGPLASIITQKMGMMESAFIVHFGGAVAALLPLLFMSGGKIGLWRSLPWYTLFTGVLGLVVLSAVSYAIPRIGVAGAITSIVTGQLLISALLDHFGWLGAAVRPLDSTRILGLAVLFLGVWLTVK